ncbi:MAG: restriction endonuclease subunit S [Clostridium sp.]
MAKNIPLWQITTWDKNFNNVDKEWQPKTIKYKYLLSDELDSLRVDDGDIRILYTGKDVGYTTEELAGDNISEGEVVSIPWGGIPTVKYHKGKFVTGDNRIATSNDTSKLTNKYLYYYLQGNIGEIASYYRGASLKHPCMKDVLKMTISYPSVQEQEKICSQFDMLEWLIEARKQELQLLDDLIKARFVEMFGSIHESTKYPYIAVKDLTDVISGGTPSRDRSEYWYNGTIPWVKTTELQNNVIKNVDEHITESGLAGSSAKMVPIGTVLVAMYGQGKTRGMTAYLGIEASTNQACACILPSEKIDSMFMWKYFELSYDKLRSLAQGAGQPNLNGNMIKNFQVLVPPIELQKEFVSFVEQVDKSKLMFQKLHQKLNILQQKAGDI